MMRHNIKTKYWGPHAWEFLHSIAYGYPDRPTDKDKSDYGMFFENIMHVLPCVYCRKSYAKFILSDNDMNIWNSNALDSQKTLVAWVWKVHECVNNKLDVNQSKRLSLRDVFTKYAKQIATKCIET